VHQLQERFAGKDVHIWKDTKHEYPGELLDAESFGAFPSGFASVARLRGINKDREGREIPPLYNTHIYIYILYKG